MMKIATILKGISFSIPLFYSIAMTGQESSLQEKIKNVQEFMTAVEANKLTYAQELTTVSPGYYDYIVKEVNSKGQEEETIYSFGLSDINENAVRTFTKRDVILIELMVKGKQKLIKRTTDDGDKVAYISDFTMYGLNADNGRDLEKAIEDAIPDAIALDEKSLSLNTYEDHLKWLETNVTNVTLPKEQIVQQLSFENAKPGFVLLEQSPGSKKQRFEFNLSLLNPNSVNYEISGAMFSVEIRTKKGVNGIKYLEDGRLDNFTDKVTFYANSLSNGKNIHRVLKGVVPLAEEKFDKSKPDIASVPKALKYLNDHINTIESGDRTTTQQLELKKNMAIFSRKETESDKSEEHGYNFNITDINKSGLNFKSKKNRLFMVLNTNKGVPYIGHTENGEIENYEKELLFYFNSWDEALTAQDALKFLIQHFEDEMPDNENLPAISLEEALALLKPKVGAVENGDDQYGQFLELLETETSTIKLTKVESNSKKSNEFVFEFSTIDLNKSLIEVRVSGKRVWAELGTKSSEKVIKVYEDGQVQNYRDNVEIETSDIESAKGIVAVFKRLVESQNK